MTGTPPGEAAEAGRPPDGRSLSELLESLAGEALTGLARLASAQTKVAFAGIAPGDAAPQWTAVAPGWTGFPAWHDVPFRGLLASERSAPVVVPDAAADARFAEHPLVRGPDGLRFYAAVPLAGSGGRVAGWLHLMDRAPRELTARQQAFLRALGEQAAAQLDWRAATRRLADREARLATLFNASPIPMTLLRARDGVWIEVNDAFARLVGRSPRDLAGRPAAELGFWEAGAGEPWRPPADQEEAAWKAETSVTLPGGDRRLFLLMASLVRLQDEPHVLAAWLDVTEQRATETALRASEERNRYINEVVTDYTYAFRVDEDGSMHGEWVSASFHRIFGLTLEEVNARGGWQSMVYPEDLPIALAHARKVVGGEKDVCEMRFVTRSGEPRWLRDYAVPVWDEAQKRVVRIYGASQDITEQKRAEEQIARLNRTYQVLSEINQLMVRERDAGAMLQGACRIAVQRGGFRLAWIGLTGPKDRTFRIAAHAGADAGTLEIIESMFSHEEPDCAFTLRALRTGRHAVCNDIARDPEAAGWRDQALARGYRSMASFPLAIAGRPQGTLNLYADQPGFFDDRELHLLDELAADIGFALEACEAEQRRREAEARVRRLAVFPELNPNPVLEFSADGKLLYQNPAARTLAASLEAESVFELLPPETKALVRECLEQGRPRRGLEVRRGEHTLAWAFYPMVELGAVHVYGIDITERMRLEEQLRQAQKLEAIGRLAGGVAHDFNNILAAILMQAELLDMEEGLSETAREGVRHIIRAAERGANLTRQLLLFSRRQVMQPRILDLNEVVTEIAPMIQRLIGEDIQLELRLHQGTLPVRADHGMLDQVLLNLAVNSRDAMPRGGRLTIETFRRDVSPEEASSLPEAQPGVHVGLRVTDTGVGIPPEMLPRLFDPFFTTKEVGKGTGLGLATVYGIVQQHHGFIRVTSQPGQGATFEVCLPAHTTAEARHDQTHGKAAPLGGQETILLVEDDPAVRMSVAATLQRRGYEVLEADDGVSAQELWRQHRDRIALLLTDLVMPGGLTGQELAQRLLADKPGLKVIYMTGYTPDWAGQEVVWQPGRNFLQKPVSAEQLLETVRRCLDNPDTPPMA